MISTDYKCTEDKFEHFYWTRRVCGCCTFLSKNPQTVLWTNVLSIHLLTLHSNYTIFQNGNLLMVISTIWSVRAFHRSSHFIIYNTHLCSLKLKIQFCLIRLCLYVALNKRHRQWALSQSKFRLQMLISIHNEEASGNSGKKKLPEQHEEETLNLLHPTHISVFSKQLPQSVKHTIV